MSSKEEFMKITTYEEYDKRREEFRKLDIHDLEIYNHWCSLFPKIDNNDHEDGVFKEVYKIPRKKIKD